MTFNKNIAENPFETVTSQISNAANNLLKIQKSYYIGAKRNETYS